MLRKTGMRYGGVPIQEAKYVELDLWLFAGKESVNTED